MAVQFLPPQNDYSDMYQSLGQLLGSLGGLGIGYGLNQIGGKENEAKQYVDAGVLTPEQASVYLKMKTPQERSSFLKEAMKQQEARRQSDLLSRAIGVPQHQMAENPLPLQGTLGALGNIQGPRVADTMQQLIASGLNPQNLSLAEKILTSEEKRKMEERKFSSKERTEAYKLTAPFRAEITKQAENADHLVETMKEQKKLISSGKMDTALYVSAIDHFLPFEALKSPETQAYQALEKEYLKDLKSIFGGRITDKEMSNFLRSIPRAVNSPEAQKMIMSRLDAYYKAKQLKYKVMRQIVKDNNGIPPLDLQEQVQDKTGEKETQYANQFLGIPKGAQLVQNKRTGQRGYKTKDGTIIPIEG